MGLAACGAVLRWTGRTSSTPPLHMRACASANNSRAPPPPPPPLQLAEELGYAVGDSAKPGASEWQEHISEVAASTGLSGRQVG